MEARACSTCGKSKEISSFHYRDKKKGIRRKQCSACHSVSKRKWYLSNKNKVGVQVRGKREEYRDRNRDYILSYMKDKNCADCGENNSIVLEFDHTSDNKIANVSKLVYEGYSISRIEKEIAKCEVVCANCHRIRTYIRCNSYRVAQGN